MAFEIEFSTRRARAEVAALNSAVKNLGFSADGAGAKLKGSLGSLGGANALKNINASIISVNQNLTRMGNHWKKAAATGSASAKSLNKRVSTTRRTFQRARVGADQYGNSLLTVSQKAAVLRSGMLAMGTHVGIFSATTLVAATVTFGFVKALKAVVTIGSEFTRSLAETSAIVGVSREQLGELTDQMLELAATTKFTTTEVAKAATILAKTGLKTVEIAGALPAVLNLAAIGSLEMAQAADIAANAMFGFQLKTQDLGRVVDTLAFAATNSNTTVKQLGSALSFAAPVAAAANAEFKEVAFMMAVMADSGIKASKAGTTLRRAYVNLLAPGAKAAVVLSDLGVETRTVEGGMRSLVDIIKDFAKAGGNVVDLENLVGVRALPGMVAVWKDLQRAVGGADSKFEEMIERWERDGLGSSDKMRKAMEKNLIDTWLKFASVLSVEATRAFDLIEDRLVSSVEAMTRFVRESIDVTLAVQKMQVWLKFAAEEAVIFAKSINNLTFLISETADAWDKGFAKMREAAAFLIQSFVDLPQNLNLVLSTIKVIVEAAGAGLAVLFNQATNIAETGVAHFTFAILKGFTKLRIAFFDLVDSMTSGLRSQLRDLALIADFFDLDSMAEGLNKAAKAMVVNTNSSAAATAVLAVQEAQRLRILAGLEDEAKLLKQVGIAIGDNADDAITKLVAERAARLGARDATMAQLDEVKRLKKATSRTNRAEQLGPNPTDSFSGNERLPLQSPPSDLLKNTNKEFKQFIKLQKASVVIADAQINSLVVMKDLSVFEGLRAKIEKLNRTSEDLTSEYELQFAAFSKWQAIASDGGYLDVAAQYQKQMDTLTVTYEAQSAALERSVSKQSNALTLLQERYRVVKDAAGEYRIEVNRQQELSESDLLKGVDAIREEGMSPGDKAAREYEERQRVLDEAHIREQTVFKEHNELKLISEKEYLDRSLQLQIQGARAQSELWGGAHTEIFDFAESVRQRDTQGILSNGIAALDVAGRTNKKAFELSKKAKIAQAIMATASGMAEALKWGFPMGPIFAGLIAASGFIQIQAIKNTKFGGGGGSAPSPPSTSVPTVAAPTLVDVPSQSDALFNQTTTGGQANTVDSSTSNVSLKFEFSAVDAKGIDSLLKRKAPQIVNLVQSAYNEKGRTGGPLV